MVAVKTKDSSVSGKVAPTVLKNVEDCSLEEKLDYLVSMND